MTPKRPSVTPATASFAALHLASCEGAFAERHIGDAQLLFRMGGA